MAYCLLSCTEDQTYFIVPTASVIKATKKQGISADLAEGLQLSWKFSVRKVPYDVVVQELGNDKDALEATGRGIEIVDDDVDDANTPALNFSASDDRRSIGDGLPVKLTICGVNPITPSLEQNVIDTITLEEGHNAMSKQLVDLHTLTTALEQQCTPILNAVPNTVDCNAPINQPQTPISSNQTPQSSRPRFRTPNQPNSQLTAYESAMLDEMRKMNRNLGYVAYYLHKKDKEGFRIPAVPPVPNRPLNLNEEEHISSSPPPQNDELEQDRGTENIDGIELLDDAPPVFDAPGQVCDQPEIVERLSKTQIDYIFDSCGGIRITFTRKIMEKLIPVQERKYKTIKGSDIRYQGDIGKLPRASRSLVTGKLDPDIANYALDVTYLKFPLHPTEDVSKNRKRLITLVDDSWRKAYCKAPPTQQIIPAIAVENIPPTSLETIPPPPPALLPAPSPPIPLSILPAGQIQNTIRYNVNVDID